MGKAHYHASAAPPVLDSLKTVDPPRIRPHLILSIDKNALPCPNSAVTPREAPTNIKSLTWAC
jgi:hypothetical protein